MNYDTRHKIRGLHCGKVPWPHFGDVPGAPRATVCEACIRPVRVKRKAQWLRSFHVTWVGCVICFLLCLASQHSHFRPCPPHIRSSADYWVCWTPMYDHTRGCWISPVCWFAISVFLAKIFLQLCHCSSAWVFKGLMWPPMVKCKASMTNGAQGSPAAQIVANSISHRAKQPTKSGFQNVMFHLDGNREHSPTYCV